MFYNKQYSQTCLRYRKSCDKACSNPNKNCPPFTPDFIKLAESYGAKAIRVTKSKDIEKALKQAKKNKNTPTLIEFIIDREVNVLPMVKPGNSLSQMTLELENEN